MSSKKRVLKPVFPRENGPATTSIRIGTDTKRMLHTVRQELLRYVMENPDADRFPSVDELTTDVALAIIIETFARDYSIPLD